MVEKVLWWVGLVFLVQATINGFGHVLIEAAAWGRAFPKAAEPALHTPAPGSKVSPTALLLAVLARTLFAVWLFWMAYLAIWRG